jgi:hypothetical protein
MERVRIAGACSRQNPDILAAPDLTKSWLTIASMPHHCGLTSCPAGVWRVLYRCHESSQTPA